MASLVYPKPPEEPAGTWSPDYYAGWDDAIDAVKALVQEAIDDAFGRGYSDGYEAASDRG